MTVPRALDLLAEFASEHRLTLKYPLAELREFLVAVKQRDRHAMLDEFQDVMLALQLYVWQRLRLNAPVVLAGGTIRKFRERNKIWREMFELRGVVFDTKFLVGGSNFNRPHKIQRAFLAAGVRLGAYDAEELRRWAREQLAESDSGRLLC